MWWRFFTNSSIELLAAFKAFIIFSPLKVLIYEVAFSVIFQQLQDWNLKLLKIKKKIKFTESFTSFNEPNLILYPLTKKFCLRFVQKSCESKN